MKPWHDTPRCPEVRRDGLPCNGPLVQPSWSGRADRVSDPAHRLICCACGCSCFGTDAELAQAIAADKAYDEARARGET